MAAAGPDNVDDKEEEINNPQPGTGSDSPKRERGFIAGKGGFEKVPRRSDLWSVLLYGEAVSVATAAAQRYVEDEFPRVIEKEAFFPNKFLIWTKRICYGRGCRPARFSSRMR